MPANTKLKPRIVLRAADEIEVSRILTQAHDMNLPVTFRAAGTSLSGQAITDSILLGAGKHWEKWEYHDEHHRHAAAGHRGGGG